MTAFCDVALPLSRPDDGDSTHLWNNGGISHKAVTFLLSTVRIWNLKRFLIIFIYPSSGWVDESV
jgi:hypothetical protein